MANKMTVVVKFDDARIFTLLSHLQEAGKRFSGEAARRALRIATTPIVQDAKRLVPRRYGLLKKSIGRLIKTYKNPQATVAIVGPQRGFRRVIKGKPHDPVKYAHLVEFGRGPVTVKRARILTDGETYFGKKVGPARARPFMRPAWDAHKGTIQDVIVRVLQEELRKLGLL